jgi:lysyl-tRNA synthetase class II
MINRVRTLLQHEARPFSSKTSLSAYFKPTMSLAAFRTTFAEKPSESSIKVAGRVVGKRKASSTLVFLDIESNGDRL